MNIRRALSPCAVLLLASCTPLAAQGQDLATATLEATHVAGAVHVITGPGGNIGVLAGSDGILIVDDKFAPLADRIRAAVAKIGPGDLRFVLNTHWHADHTGANPAFGKGATIVAHENVRRRLGTRQERGGTVTEPMVTQDLPVVTFDDDVTIHFNGETIAVRHVPRAHTDGDAIVVFPDAKVVHMGDLFFNGMFPFVDVDSGGTVDGLIEAVGALLPTFEPATKLIPGHGPLGTVEDLRAYHHMLTETRRLVREARAQGRSLTDMKKVGLGEDWKRWSWQFVPTEQWIERLWGADEGSRPGAATHH